MIACSRASGPLVPAVPGTVRLPAEALYEFLRGGGDA